MPKPHEMPFIVRQSGIEYAEDSEEKGALAGFNDMKSAEEDAADRNRRAEELGVKARYEACDNS